MILGSKAIAWLYLSWPIQAETSPKLHRKAPPPCTAGAILVPALPQSTGLQVSGLASAGSDFPQPPSSSEAKSSSTLSPPHPTPLHSVSKPEALGTYPTQLPLAVKDQRVPTPQPDSRENQRQGPSQPLKITPAVLKSGFPGGSCLSEGLWRKQCPLPAGDRSRRRLFPAW